MNERSIFMEALAKETLAERSAYLAQVCGHDTALRQRVEALLVSHEQADSFLRKPVPERLAKLCHGPEQAGQLPQPQAYDPNATGSFAPASPADAPQETPPGQEKPGMVIGPYKLLQQIGEGGFGIVFMAEQTQPLLRKVALKVIKTGMDSRQIIARFEAERQALAMMDHANIARVLDAGATASGRPYFVMELVHGVPITQYCDDNHLMPRERLELFVPVCLAIQHAHQKGIIHRDIKPSNVMVTLYDGKPVPKVIDFGVAKAIEQRLTERTLFTQYGMLVGTLEYMSPEQAEMSALGVDTRSDIYSLGVLLYELLTGSTPLTHKRLKEAAFGEILRLIKEEEPPKPSTRLSDSGEALASISAQRHMEPAKLSKLMRGELDWIVMKTLEKDRNRRYETPNALARDIQGYLSDEPVQACPPSARYKLGKFVRRHKRPVLAAAGFAALGVLGMVGLVLGMVTVNAERQRTADALAAETKARLQTREALNAMTDDVIETLFAKQPHLADNEKAFLRRVLSFYQAFAADKGETEEARFLVASGQFRVAKVRAFLGETSAAVAGYRDAIQQLEKLAADFPTVPKYRAELAGSHNNLGVRLCELGNLPEAEIGYRQAQAILEKLVADFPTVPEYRNKLASNQNNRSALLCELGNRTEGEMVLRQALAILEKLVADFPTDPEYRNRLANGHYNLGNLLRELGKRPQAATAYRQAQSILQKLIANFPTDPEYRDRLASSHNNMGLLLHDLGQPPEAVTAFRHALAIKGKLVADFPSVPAYRHELASSHNNLGLLLRELGKPPEAETAYGHALAILEKLAADFPAVPEYRHKLANSHNNLGTLLRDQGKRSEAATAYRHALAILEKLVADLPAVPEYRAELASSHDNLGRLLHAQGQRPEAATAYRHALAILEKLAADFPTVPAHRTELAGSCVNFGSLLRSQQRPEEALEWYAKAIESLEVNLTQDAHLATERLFLRNAHWNRALALSDLQRHAEAIKDWDRVIELDKGRGRSEFRLQRAMTLAHAGDHARAVTEADDLARTANIPGGALYNLACVYGVSMAAVKENASMKEQCARKALVLLRRAQTAGFFKDANVVEHMKQNDDLAALRGRADFQALLAALEASKAKK